MSRRRHILAALHAAYHEGQQYRQKAKQRALPPDPARWLDEAEHYAQSLPDGLPQRRVILRQAQQARQCIGKGDDDEALFFMLQIEENGSNAEHDKRALSVAEGNSRGGTKGASSKQTQRNARAQDARRRYDRLASTPERDRAAIVARDMGLTPRTVRNYLADSKKAEK